MRKLKAMCLFLSLFLFGCTSCAVTKSEASYSAATNEAHKNLAAHKKATGSADRAITINWVRKSAKEASFEGKLDLKKIE